MRFERVVELCRAVPVFESGLLLAGEREPANVRRQLSRWKASGKVIQLRRGLYTLAPIYRTVDPHPFLVANRLVRGSYISLESALAYHGHIPEHVPETTSVTTGRPGLRDTPLGRFSYRHLKRDAFNGFEPVEVATAQTALVASPEKALLDLVHLRPGGDDPEFLAELRPQNLEELDVARLRSLADTPKLKRAAEMLASFAEAEAEAYDIL